MANLYEYYNTQGKALPTVQERQGVATQAGIQGYTGTAAQNSQLLNYLQSPSTRPLDQVQGATTPVMPEVPSLAPSLNAMATASNQATLGAETAVQGAEQNLNSTTSELTSLMQQLGGEQADRNAAEQAAGLDTMNRELIDLQNTARQQAIQYSMTPYSLEGQGRGITTGILRGQEAVKQRQLAIDQMVTNSNIAAKQGNILLAQNIADRAVAAKYDPIKQTIETKKFILEAQYKDLSRADKKLADAQTEKLNAQLREIEQKEKTESELNSLRLEIIKNGGDPSKLANVKSVSEALSVAGNLLRTPNTEVIKLGDNQAYLIDKNTGKVIKSFGGGGGGGTGLNVGGMNGQYKGIVDTILASGKFTKDQASAIRNAINNGEDPFTVVKNNAKNIMGSALATDLAKKEDALSQVQALDGLMKRYYAAGGKTNIFSGNYQKAINRVGEISDPALVDIATQIAVAMQAYRLAVTGTAASVQEDSRIDAIFPGITSGELLNNTKTKAVMDSFQRDVDSAYRSVVGSPYDSLKTGVSKTILTKGGLSDMDFVEKSLTKQGIKYEDIINKVPAGSIPVLDNETGAPGFILINEFNPSKYTKL